MDMIFLIIKEGIYRHDIFGAFTDSKEAAKQAKNLADTDDDDYHEYVVQPVPVNSINKVVGRHRAEEPAHTASFVKQSES